MSAINANGDDGGAARTEPLAVQGTAAGQVVPVGGLVATGSTGPGRSMAELRERRFALAEKVAELTWDLGGLAYEMAIRDHYRLDVIARKAAELQAADAELNEVQRLLATAEAGIHGQCRSCGAVHSRGAAFCWHCGAPLLTEARPAPNAPA
jgi:chorismate mutase